MDSGGSATLRERAERAVAASRPLVSRAKMEDRLGSVPDDPVAVQRTMEELAGLEGELTAVVGDGTSAGASGTAAVAEDHAAGVGGTGAGVGGTGAGVGGTAAGAGGTAGDGSAASAAVPLGAPLAVPLPTPLAGTLAMVRVRLGELYADRYLAQGGDPDRARATELLRAARGSGLLDPREHRRATALLAAVLARPLTLPRWEGSLAQMNEISEIGRKLATGEPSFVADLTELRELLTELTPGAPDEVVTSLRNFGAAVDLLPVSMATGDVRPLLDLLPESGQPPGMPPGLLHAGVRMMMEFARQQQDSPAPPPPPAGQPAPSGTGTPAAGTGTPAAPTWTPAREPAGQEAPATSATSAAPGAPTAPAAPWQLSDEAMTAAAILLLELANPGTLRPEELEALLGTLSSGQAGEELDLPVGVARMALGVRAGDPEGLATAARLMGAAAAKDGSGRDGWLAGMMAPGLLTAASGTGGNLVDRDTARRLLDQIFATGSGVLDSPFARGPGAEGLRLANRCLQFQGHLEEAHGTTTSRGCGGWSRSWRP